MLIITLLKPKPISNSILNTLKKHWTLIDFLIFYSQFKL